MIYSLFSKVKDKLFLYFLFREIFSVFLLIAFALYILDIYEPYAGQTDFLGVVTRYCIGISPILLVYCFFRVFLRCFYSWSIVVLITCFLSIVNAKKTLETKHVLSWNDLTGYENYQIAIRYVDVKMLLLCGIAVFFIFLFFIKGRNGNINKASVFLGVVLSFFAAPNYWSFIFPALGETVILLYGKSKWPYYISWSWSENIKKNGVFAHLIQTSFRTMPSQALDDDRKTYNLYKTNRFSTHKDHIVFILCESCWNDKLHFNEPFKSLEQHGLISLRGVSPVYGGGTPNSEFEMYTALSSNTVINGTIFQEYNSKISNAKTIVSSLRKNGYSTVAMHNFSKSFWLRDEVLPKLGFEHFYGIEDMEYKKEEQPYFPHDKILYDNALKSMKINMDKPFFYSLITVSTHGEYGDKNGDMGEADYKNRINLAMTELSFFIQEIKKLDPNVLLVVYGDHKPALNDYFEQQKILSPHEKKQEIIGDVPVYVYLGGRKSNILSVLDGMPFYCFSATLDVLLMGSGNATSNYVYDNICSTYKNIGYKSSLSYFPGWLYWLTLFDSH